MVVERYLFAHYTLLVAVMGMVVIKALEGCYGVFLLPGPHSLILCVRVRACMCACGVSLSCCAVCVVR